MRRFGRRVFWYIAVPASVMVLGIGSILLRINPILTIGGGFVALAWLVWRRSGGRRRAMAAVATKLGLSFSQKDPFGLPALPFRLFGRGDGRTAENVMHGTFGDRTVRAFDYSYYREEELTEPGSPLQQGRCLFSCAMAEIALGGQRVCIEPERFATRLADTVALDDIDFESEEFNRAFEVRADGRRFANDVVDARMIAWLLRNAGAHAFEVSGGRVMVWAEQVKPAEVVTLLEGLHAFCERIPRVAFELYPPRQAEGEAGT